MVALQRGAIAVDTPLAVNAFGVGLAQRMGCSGLAAVLAPIVCEGGLRHGMAGAVAGYNDRLYAASAHSVSAVVRTVHGRARAGVAVGMRVRFGPVATTCGVAIGAAIGVAIIGSLMASHFSTATVSRW